LEEVLILLNNCEYFSLIDPFQKEEVQGYTLNVMASINEIIQIAGSIDKIVAKAFLKHLGEWKKDGVPKAKLAAPEIIINNVLSISSYLSRLMSTF
jgi:hypothetical protein